MIARNFVQNNNEKVSLIILHGNNDGIHITAGVWLRFRCRPTFSMLYKSWNFMCKILRYKNPIVPSNFIYVYIFYSVFFSSVSLECCCAVFHLSILLAVLFSHSPVWFHGFCLNECKPNRRSAEQCVRSSFYYSFRNTVSHVASQQNKTILKFFTTI